MELYNLFKNQGLQNLTFIFVTKPNETESLSLLDVSTWKNCLHSALKTLRDFDCRWSIGRPFQRTTLEKLFFLTFVWGRGIVIYSQCSLMQHGPYLPSNYLQELYFEACV